MRVLISVVVLGLSFCGLSFAANAEAPPNILFIMVDDMGYSDLSSYGSRVISTPHIDSLGTDGMRFTNFYSGAAVCAPARSTLMTGKHLGHATLRGNTGGIAIPDEEITIAEVLKKAGYATGGFGKWGLGDIDTEGVPEKQGFDTFYGYYHQIHAHSYYPEYLIRDGKKENLKKNRNKKRGTYSQYSIFEETKKFIRKHKDESFFCYAPWTPPHGEFVIPENDPAWAKFKDKPWERRARVIAAMNEMLDRHVGELLTLLEELGLSENTIVFFCSDNGAENPFVGSLDSTGPLRGNKRMMYEGGLRVPMLVRWPGHIKAGSVSDLPGYFPDIFPTLTDLANTNTHHDLDGVSLRPTLTNSGTQVIHEALYWEQPAYDWGKHEYTPGGLGQAVRMENWKLVRLSETAPWELYDLGEDIGETTDLAGSNPEQVKRMVQWIADNRVESVEQIEPEMPAGKRYR